MIYSHEMTSNLDSENGFEKGELVIEVISETGLI